MNSMLTFTMQLLIKILTPSSPAFNNTPPFFNDQQSLDQIISMLKPGDIILSKTGSLIYQIARAFVHMDYDHVAVVINKKQVIHVSPPIISKLNLQHIVRQNRYPTIIRPNLNPEQLYHFLSILHGFLGQKYNVKAIPKIALAQIKHRLSHFNQIHHLQSTQKIQQQKNQQNFSPSKQTVILQDSNHSKNQKQQNKQLFFSQASLKFSRICSDAILYALCRSSKQVQQITKQVMDQESQYKIYGFSLPDDLLTICNKCKYQIIYKSNKTPKPNPVYAAAKDIYNYPYSSKYHQIIQYISKVPSDISESTKNLPQKMKNLIALQRINMKKIVKLTQKGFILKGHHLQVTLVIGLALKLCELLGYKITSKTTNIAFDVLGIVLMVFLFSLFPNGFFEDILKKLEAKL